MAEFKMTCPHCNAEFRVQEEWIGMKTECPVCGESFTLTRKSAEKPDVSISSADKEVESSFLFICPNCGTQAELPTALKGTKYECAGCCEESIAEPATEKKCPHCGKMINIRANICKYCKGKASPGIMDSTMVRNSKKIMSYSLQTIRRIKLKRDMQKILFILSVLFFLAFIGVFVAAVRKPSPKMWELGERSGLGYEYVSTNSSFSITVGESSHGTYKNAQNIASNTKNLLELFSVFQKSLRFYCSQDQQKKDLFNLSYGLFGVAMFLLFVSICINQIWHFDVEHED